jgi:hypothetical protein
LYDTSPTIVLRLRIDSEIIRFGRTNHQPDNAVIRAASIANRGVVHRNLCPRGDRINGSCPTSFMSGLVGRDAG